MMLRLQKERMTGGLVPSSREFFRFFGLDREKLAWAKPDAIVMHPGPMNRGVEIDSAVADDPERSVIGEQVEMGVAVRMAVLDVLARDLRRNLRMSPPCGLLFTGARLLDPRHRPRRPGRPAGPRRAIARHGAGLGRAGRRRRRWTPAALCLAPGLVDLRAAIGEPGHEHRETIASAAEAAAAGGITTLCALPDTDPALDDPALVQFILRRGEATGCITLLPYGAATKRCEGKELAEYGLLREAGAIAFTDGRRAIGYARTMRLALSYARAFGSSIVQHPEEPSLGRRRRRDRGRAGHPPRPARHPRRRRGHAGGARHRAGPAHRRACPLRPCLAPPRRWR